MHTRTNASNAMIFRTDFVLAFLLPCTVQEWQKGLNQKLEPFLQHKESLKDEEVVKLGKKDPEAYPFTTEHCFALKYFYVAEWC